MENTKNSSRTGYYEQAEAAYMHTNLSPQRPQALATDCSCGKQVILSHFTEEQTKACSETVMYTELNLRIPDS